LIHIITELIGRYELTKSYVDRNAQYSNIAVNIAHNKYEASKRNVKISVAQNPWVQRNIASVL